MGVSVGAVLLAWVLWQEDEQGSHVSDGTPAAISERST